MDNHTKRLWAPEQDFPQLRRPVLRQENTDNMKQQNDSQPTTVNTTVTPNMAVAKSTLSAEAEEWYPAGYNSTPVVNNYPTYSPSSVQNRLNKYRHVDNDNKYKGTYDYDQQLQYLYEIIKLLTLKPGKFDEVIFSLIEFLEPYFNNIEVMSKVTTVIFQQAVVETNFQYSGARLLAIMDENCPFVRACLHSLCEKELEKTSNLQNLAIFYAEIYSQLNFELFGICLLKALKKMSSHPENVKYICHTLKSVIKLRDTQWGQAEIHASGIELEENLSDGPVFYGPDGRQLTAEESDFLTENLDELMLDDTDPDALWNPEPEMNEEIRLAFADFVKATHR
ncbi:uncharacterized protein CBL_02641 [Carabus blaptoides fortunei]